jgi:hypothetical protein
MTELTALAAESRAVIVGLVFVLLAVVATLELTARSDER